MELVEQAEPHLTPGRAHWLHRVAAERDNLRAALEWGRTAPDADAVETVARLAGAIGHYWELCGYPREARDTGRGDCGARPGRHAGTSEPCAPEC